METVSWQNAFEAQENSDLKPIHTEPQRQFNPSRIVGTFKQSTIQASFEICGFPHTSRKAGDTCPNISWYTADIGMASIANSKKTKAAAREFTKLGWQPKNLRIVCQCVPGFFHVSNHKKFAIKDQ